MTDVRKRDSGGRGASRRRLRGLTTGLPRQVAFYRHGEHKIWGATARVLGRLVALLTPESAAHASARLEPGAVLPERGPGEG